VVNRLAAAAPTNAQIGTVGRLGATPITPTDVRDFAPLDASFNNTYEIGYKGLSSNSKLSFDVSAWAQQRGDVAVTAALSTPWIFANPTQTGAFVGAEAQAALTPLFLANQLTAAQLGALATGAAQGLTPVLAGIPLGTVTFNDAAVTNANLRATYARLAKEVRVWGADVGLSYQFTEKWSGDWTGSVVNQVIWDDVRVGTSAFSLNAPGAKTTLTARYNDAETGWGFEGRYRYTGGFPVNSGVYESFVFNPSGAGAAVQYPGVPTANLFDVQFSRRFPKLGKGVLWSLSATNLFDVQVPTFVGTPDIGRLVMTRLSWTF
jgi:outer membrane receptor for ferrienterochelin and colicins